MIPLAHIGHVLIDLPIFMGPVVALASWLGITSRRDRLREARLARVERDSTAPAGD